MPLRLPEKCLEVVKALPGGQGGVFWVPEGVLKCPGCFGGVSGCTGAEGVSGSLFTSISFNFRKSQMRSLTFSSRPGGPRCLKYQNVPKLRSF